MKRITSLTIIILFVFFCTGMMYAQQNKEDKKFQKTLEKYLDKLWEFYPTQATKEGYHEYDDELADLRERKIDSRYEEILEFSKKLIAEINSQKLSPEYKIDFEIVRSSLDLELLNHESLLPWNYNPLFYNEIILDSVKHLLSSDFAALEQRAENAKERLENLSDFIDQAKKNLETPPKLFTETAIQQFPGIIDFYKTDIHQLLENAPASIKADIQEELTDLIPVLIDYQSYLENELLPNSTGNFRLGEQAYLKLLRATLFNDIPLQQLLARADADYNNIRREMALVCLPFFKVMYPEINIEQLTAGRSNQANQNYIIKKVLEKIQSNHTSKEVYFSKVNSLVDEIKNFVSEKQLFVFPEVDLDIVPMPAENTSKTWINLISPGAYSSNGKYICQISPIPDDWTSEQENSFFEEYTDFLLYFWTVRNVYPGHCIPLYKSNQNATLLRKLYPSKPLIKGWPLMVEEMLVYSGLGNYDLRLRLNQLKMRLKAVIDFQLDINIHQGGMTKEKAIDYMTKGGLQSEVEAERKWKYIVLNPGEAVTTYVGLQEILDMEKIYKNSAGDSYSKKEFLNELLSYGAIPIRFLKKKFQN